VKWAATRSNSALGQVAGPSLSMRPFGFDLFGEFFDAERLDENLDARLVGVVAAALRL
jgi:hypothetical protein